MDLENILLSDRSQSQKTTYFMIPFIKVFKIGNIQIESRLVLA
jgi:hypothetical protein